MRPVVIEIDSRGNYKVISCPRKCEVIVRTPKKKTFKKRLKTALYHVKSFMSSQ
jgi:hypothetical protein